MNVSRSGYYKWLKNKDILNRYEIDRLELEKLIKQIHNIIRNQVMDTGD